MPAISLGYQQRTVSSSSVGFTTVPAGAEAAHITVETGAVRWRDDATAPTAAVGMPIAAGDSLWFEGDLAATRFIRQTVDATLNVTFYSTQ